MQWLYSGSKSVMSAVKCFIGVDVDTKRHDCCEGSCLRHKEPQLPRVRVTQTRLPVNQVDHDRCDTFLCHAKLNRFTNSPFLDSKSTLSGWSGSFVPQSTDILTPEGESSKLKWDFYSPREKIFYVVYIRYRESVIYDVIYSIQYTLI